MTSPGKPTKGPWIVTYGATRATVSADGKIIAYIHEGYGAIPDYDTRDADARLIAEAPTMRDAMAEFVKFYSDWPDLSATVEQFQAILARIGGSG